MPRHRPFIRCVVVAVAVSSACADGSTAPVDTVQAADGQSRVRTLLVEVDVRLGDADTPALSDRAGFYLHRSQVDTLTLNINGSSWGTLTNSDIDEPTPPDAVTAAGWVLTSTPSPALMIADLADQSAADPDQLQTVADWVTLLSRYLAPGGYVVDLDRVRLLASDESTMELPIGERWPFEILPEQQSAYLGRIEIIAELGGRP